MSTATERFVGALERLGPLDSVVDKVGEKFNERVPAGPVKDALSGPWLGHPVHPWLTDMVIGFWTGALFLDVLGGGRGQKAADRLIGLGILSAVPTAVTGLNDLVDTLPKNQRRLGAVHATSNAIALLMYTRSWFNRKRGRRGRGFLQSLAGAGVMTVGAWLGGHLVYAKGVGVDQTVFEERPDEWTAVIDAGELSEGKPVEAMAGPTRVMLYREGDRIFALADRCTHRGCGLHGGEVENGIVTCPCHGSQFRLEDGELVRGPAITPQPAFDARLRSGRVEVRAKERIG